MNAIDRQKLIETPNEDPIKCVLSVLGFLSLIATISVAGVLNEQLLFFNVTTVGFICGLISLPVGYQLAEIMSISKQNPDLATA